jgi:hypothetical protein
MQTLLFRIKTTENPHLTDDEVVAKCMKELMHRWPQVKGYQYERDGEAIQILLWGDINTSPEEES